MRLSKLTKDINVSDLLKKRFNLSVKNDRVLERYAPLFEKMKKGILLTRDQIESSD